MQQLWLLQNLHHPRIKTTLELAAVGLHSEAPLYWQNSLFMVYHHWLESCRDALDEEKRKGNQLQEVVRQGNSTAERYRVEAEKERNQAKQYREQTQRTIEVTVSRVTEWARGNNYTKI